MGYLGLRKEFNVGREDPASLETPGAQTLQVEGKRGESESETGGVWAERGQQWRHRSGVTPSCVTREPGALRRGHLAGSLQTPDSWEVDPIALLLILPAFPSASPRPPTLGEDQPRKYKL